MSDSNAYPAMTHDIVENGEELKNYLEYADKNYSYEEDENIPNFIANHIQDYGSEHFGDRIKELLLNSFPDDYDVLVIELTD
jgi:hypothetical protein